MRLGRRDAVTAALVVVGAAAVAAGWWVTRSPEVSSTTPVGAPAVGSCWAVDAAASGGAHPWPGTQVDCAQPHTVEIFSVAQVDHDVIRQARDTTGQDAILAENLMYAQARLACSNLGRGYLGGDWHAGRVDVIANWIKPDKSGFFACGAVETSDPGAAQPVSRPGSLKGVLADGGLAIECVSRPDGGASLVYSGCDTAHEGEFVGAYVITPAQAPFHEAGVRGAAQRGCDDMVRRFLGLAAGAGRTGLRAAYVGPTTAGAWLGSDQAFACYVMADENVQGSLRGLGEGPLPVA